MIQPRIQIWPAGARFALQGAILIAAAMAFIITPVSTTLAWPGNGNGHGGGGGGGHQPPPVQFAGCGSVVQGVECLLFAADSGGTYIVGGLEAYQPGDRIFVQGTIDRFCVSYCQQGNGCIFNSTISACAQLANAGGGGSSGGPPTFDVANLLDLISSWGNCDEDGVCQWDLNGDGRVDARDLVILVRNVD